MEENARRQITWVIILGLIAIIVITASSRRGELKALANVIADGTPAQRIEAVRILIDKQKLTEALDEQPRWVQDNAVAAAAYLGDNEAIFALTGTCWQLDKPVAPRAVDAIVARNCAAITPLVQAMQDKDGNVRGGAGAPLVAIGPPVIPSLMELVSAWDQYVRDGVVAAFSDPKIGAAVAPKLITIMKQKQPRKDQSPAEFQRAHGTARASLVGMKVPAVTHILTQLVPDADAEIRADAAAMVGEIDATAGVLAPDVQKTIQPLLGLLNADPAWTVRRKAAAALGGLQKDTLPPGATGVAPSLADKFGATDSLIAHLHDSSNDVKAAAAEALGKIGNPKADGPLAQTLLTNRTGAVREISVALIAIAAVAPPPPGKPNPKPAIDALSPLLSSGEEEVRRTATETIGQIGSENAVVPLAGMLKDREPAIREIASDALRGLADERVVPQLIAALNDDDWRVYHAARDGLAHVGKPAVVTLIPSLSNPNPRVSSMAEQALARIGKPAVPQLIAALGSADAAVADWVGVTLGDIGADAIEDVAAALASSTMSVTSHAAAARALGHSGVLAAAKPLVDAFPGSPAPVQTAIVKAIDELSAPDGTATLVAAIQVPDPNVRETAMRVLRTWRLGKVQELLTAVVQSGDENSKRRAAIVLAEQTSASTQELLSQATGVASGSGQDISAQLLPILQASATDATETKSVRAFSVRSLGFLGLAGGLPTLQTLLQPGDPFAADAAKSVAMIGRRTSESQATATMKAQLSDAAKILVELLKKTPDAKLRLDVAVALSLMHGQPVKTLIDSFLDAPEDVKPWIAATLGAIGKSSTDPLLDVRGVTKIPDQKKWCAASLQLVGDAQALDLLKHLADEEQPDAAMVASGQKVLDLIRANRQ